MLPEPTSHEKAEASLADTIKNNRLVNGDEKILVLGANGKLGTFLVPLLKQYYPDNLILADVKKNGDVEAVDVTNIDSLKNTISTKRNVKVVINLAAERNPKLANQVNIEAPKVILDLAKKAGVRTVFMPSSVAVLERDSRQNAFDNEFGSPIDSPVNPIGTDGKAKKEIEALFAENNRQQQPYDGTQALCLRYGSVLSCQPSQGSKTTEEIDKMVAAAAKLKARQARAVGQQIKEKYVTTLPLSSTFLLLDDRTVASETLRFLHADRDKLWENGHRYPLAEYSASIGQVADELAKEVKGFTVLFSERHYEPHKERFMYNWPTKLDTRKSIEDWGCQQHFTLEKSIDDHLAQLVGYFRNTPPSSKPAAY